MNCLWHPTLPECPRPRCATSRPAWSCSSWRCPCASEWPWPRARHCSRDSWPASSVPPGLGHDPDPEAVMALHQPDRESTFSELLRLIDDIHPGAAAIGLASIALLVIWDRWGWLKRSAVPAPLVVVLLGVLANEAF